MQQAHNRATHLRFMSWLRWRRPWEVILKESGRLSLVRACRVDRLCRVASVTPNLSRSRDLHSGGSGEAGTTAIRDVASETPEVR